MENWLKDIQDRLLQDRTLRLAVVVGVAVLFLFVIVDAFGARERAVAAREAARLAGTDDTPTATVPSVYRVPRDLASEAALAARAAQDTATSEDAVAEAEVAEAEADAEVAEMDVAEAEAAEADEAPAEVAEVAEDAAEDSAAEAVAEDDATTEEAPAEVAAAAEDAVDDSAAEPVAAEDATTEEAPAELAEAAEDAVEVASEPELAEAETDAAPLDDSMALLATADLENAQRVWRQCAACHIYETEQNRGGPHLVNIIGRDVASAEGWRYSRALQERGGVWTVESLLSWLENPDSYIPGNQMAFRGLRNEQDRIDVLGLLSGQSQD